MVCRADRDHEGPGDERLASDCGNVDRFLAALPLALAAANLLTAGTKISYLMD
jgi:hypothetical protein